MEVTFIFSDINSICNPIVFCHSFSEITCIKWGRKKFQKEAFQQSLDIYGFYKYNNVKLQEGGSWKHGNSCNGDDIWERSCSFLFAFVQRWPTCWSSPSIDWKALKGGGGREGIETLEHQDSCIKNIKCLNIQLREFK